MKNKIIDYCDDSIFDVKGKDYSQPKKETDWGTMAILAILVMAVGFIFYHVLLEFGVIMAVLTIIGIYTLHKILSDLIG